MTRVKVCGLTRAEDVEVAVRAGAHALGFVFEPTSPRCVLERAEVLALAEDLPPFVQAVAVFGSFFQHPTAMALPVVQALDPPESEHQIRLRTVRLSPTTSVEEVLAMELDADALVLDSYDPVRLGGTGARVDWGLAAEIVAEATLPVILAGGLGPENVAEAVRHVRPYGVDASSRLEVAPGIKDADRVARFVSEALAASFGN